MLSEKRNKFKDHKTRLGANEEKTELIMKKLLRKTSSAGLKLWKWNTVKIEDPRIRRCLSRFKTDQSCWRLTQLHNDNIFKKCTKFVMKNFSIEARKSPNKFTLYIHIQQFTPSSSAQDPLCKGGKKTQEAFI